MLNTSKTKWLVIDFQRKPSAHTPVNIQGSVIEPWMFSGWVHLNNKLDWTDNTNALYRKGQSHLHLLRSVQGSTPDIL